MVQLIFRPTCSLNHLDLFGYWELPKEEANKAQWFVSWFARVSNLWRKIPEDQLEDLHIHSFICLSVYNKSDIKMLVCSAFMLYYD